MKRSQSERKAELLAKAELLIDELLKWEAEAEKPTFAAIEGAVMKLGKQMDEALIEEVLREQALAKEQAAPLCESCGLEMEHKGRKERGIGGWVGEAKVKRAYYHCPNCKTGFFPSGPSIAD